MELSWADIVDEELKNSPLNPETPTKPVKNDVVDELADQLKVKLKLKSKVKSSVAESSFPGALIDSCFELYDFNPKKCLKTYHIKELYGDWEYEKGGFRVQWVDDDRVILIFSLLDTALEAFKTVQDPRFKTRACVMPPDTARRQRTATKKKDPVPSEQPDSPCGKTKVPTAEGTRSSDSLADAKASRVNYASALKKSLPAENVYVPPALRRQNHSNVSQPSTTKSNASETRASQPDLNEPATRTSRPTTNALVAHRLIASALGLPAAKRSEEREKRDQESLRKAKEQKEELRNKSQRKTIPGDE